LGCDFFLNQEGGAAYETWRPGTSGYNVAMPFKLRDFRAGDFEVLWGIDQQCFVAGIAYSRQELALYMRRRGSFTIVAEAHPEDSDKNGAVGFIVAESNRRGVGHVITIDVLPARQRSGLGSQLLNAAENRLRTANCHAVVLETAVDNKTALAFYKRHGYSVVKVEPRYYGNGVDAFVLEKDLMLTPSNLRTSR
jgi:ribosomal protein S18 acetylase RimI-like enzyme